MMGFYDPFAGLGDMSGGGSISLPYPYDFTSGGGGGGIDWTSIIMGGLGGLFQSPVTVPAPGGGMPLPIPGWPPPTQFPSAPQLPTRGRVGRVYKTSRGGVPTFRVNVFGGRRRRMNACNPRALRRAIRRVKHFEKFAKQSVKISHHVKLQKGRGRKTCR